MTPGQVGTALIGLALLLLAGKLVRLHWRAGQNLFLPASILGGAIGLALGPDILGGIVGVIFGSDHTLADGLIPADVLEVWSSLPGLMINVVFATLLLGVPLPRWRRVWHLAGPQLAFGLSLASGQYILGILLAVAVLVPVFGLPVMAGALIEIGFEGGHGTAAGLQPVFA
ncbi:MAG: sodium:glutamate symporter, partial [Salinisphaeraceae bacterium]